MKDKRLNNGKELKLEPIPTTVNKIMSELTAEAHLDSKKPETKSAEKPKVAEVVKKSADSFAAQVKAVVTPAPAKVSAPIKAVAAPVTPANIPKVEKSVLVAKPVVV